MPNLQNILYYFLIVVYVTISFSYTCSLKYAFIVL